MTKFCVTIHKYTKHTTDVIVEANNSFEAVQQVVNSGKSYKLSTDFKFIDESHDFTTRALLEKQDDNN